MNSSGGQMHLPISDPLDKPADSPSETTCGDVSATWKHDSPFACFTIPNMPMVPFLEFLEFWMVPPHSTAQCGVRNSFNSIN